MTVTASTFNTPLEALFDRTAYLLRRLASHVPGAADPSLLPGAVPEFSHLVHAASIGPATNFEFLNGPFAWQQQSEASAGSLILQIPRPPTGKIGTVTAFLKGDTGHAALPATMPLVNLYRQVRTGADSGTLVATASDTSASVGAYEVGHVITFSPNHTLVSQNFYYLEFKGETGANAEPALLMLGIEISWEAV